MKIKFNAGCTNHHLIKFTAEIKTQLAYLNATGLPSYILVDTPKNSILMVDW